MKHFSAPFQCSITLSMSVHFFQFTFHSNTFFMSSLDLCIICQYFMHEIGLENMDILPIDTDFFEIPLTLIVSMYIWHDIYKLLWDLFPLAANKFKCQAIDSYFSSSTQHFKHLQRTMKSSELYQSFLLFRWKLSSSEHFHICSLSFLFQEVSIFIDTISFKW